jgi:hypothetical protein
LEQKIVTLTSSNSNLKEIQREYEDYRRRVDERSQEEK